MPPAAGIRLGRYQLRSPLGAGGMGEVYEAEDLDLGRTVAIKFLAREAQAAPEAKRRLRVEARALAALNHPNIATIYELGELDGLSFIVMERATGETLARRLERSPLALAQAIKVALEIAAGLQAAHARGLVHCDLKSSNIMLAPEGQAKILDFGLAQAAAAPLPCAARAQERLASVRLAEGEAQDFTPPLASDANGGTPICMSPEQLRGEAPDARADIFALGIVLYEMLTGQHPFAGSRRRPEIINAILSADPPPLRAFRADAPLELENILRRALAKNAAARYQSAAEMAADLTKLRERLEPPAAAAHVDAEATSAAAAATGARGCAQASAAPTSLPLSAARRYRHMLLIVGITLVLAAGLSALPLRSSGGAPVWSVWLLALAAAAFSSYAVLRRKSAASLPAASLKGVAFRGLLPFQEADRDCFYGREIDTLALSEIITHGQFRFGVLFGDSGSGKTSLLKAGLIPKLWEEGYAPIYCRSYKDPLAVVLAEAERRSLVASRAGEDPTAYLRRVGDEMGATIVIICDQFEEFFVNLKTAEERASFVSFVVACHETEGLPVKFLFSLRSDFLYLINAEFAGRIPDPLLSARLYHLRSFNERSAAEIIERSARKANLPFAPTFSRHVARDLATGDAVLPSELQIVGEQLQTKRIFTVEEYRRAGGKEQLVHGFLQDVVEASGDREGAHLLLRSLISDENTRLTLTLAEIAKRTQRSREEVERSLRLFVAARLVSELQDEEPWRYELTHEYLIEKINQITGRVMDATQRANRLLRQYLSDYATDKRTRIPLSKLWFIRRYAEAARGQRERELWRKSLRWGLLKAGALALLLAVVTTAAAAALSVEEEWESRTLRDGHTAAARQIAFSPDGRLLVSVGEDSKVIVWDFARRERLATFADHTARVTCVAFSPDGRWFATGSDDRTVIVWDAAGLRRAAVLGGHEGPVITLAFSPDGRLLASMAGERTVLWEIESREQVRELPGVAYSYGNMQFSADGRQLISQLGEAWDVTTGRQAADALQPEWGSNWTAFSPDARHLVAVDSTGYVRFAEERRITGRHHIHQDHGRAAAFSPDGRLVATGAETIILWDAATQARLTRLDHTSIVWSLAFSPGGRHLVSAHGDGSILVWDVAERERIANFNEHSAPVRVVAFSADGKLVASAGEDRSIIIWNAATGQKEATLLAHRTRLTALAFSPDGSWLASTDQEAVTNWWDLTQRRLVWSAQYLNQGRYQAANYCLAISPDGRFVVTTSAIYAADGGRLLVDNALRNSSESLWRGGIYSAAFSPDGRRLFFGSDYGELLLLDAEGWQLLERLETDRTIGFTTISLSSDGKWLVTGDVSGAIRLWAVEPFREVAALGQHSARIKSVTFSPDGRQVASAGDDNTIALWDVSRQRLLTRIGTHTAPVLSLAFSPDGRQLVSGEHDRSVRLHRRYRSLWGYRLD